MISTKLTFAVQPKDAFSPKKKVMGKCKVKIVEVDKEPIENRSGYHCFTDLPDGEYKVETSNRYYEEKLIDVETDELDPKLPAVDVILEPNLFDYPFPAGTTILRGIVINKYETDEVVAGAKVKLIDHDNEFISDEKGRFVFLLDEIEDESEIEIKVTKKDYHKEKIEITLKKGNMNFIKVKLEPKK